MDSLIVRIFGVYQLNMRDYDHRLYFYVMRNIFPPHKAMDEKYDIKGMEGEGTPFCPGEWRTRCLLAPFGIFFLFPPVDGCCTIISHL